MSVSVRNNENLTGFVYHQLMYLTLNFQSNIDLNLTKNSFSWFVGFSRFKTQVSNPR